MSENVVDDATDWRAEIAGDDSEAMESLKGFETPADLGKAYLETSRADWRTEFAGDDEKLQNKLSRFATKQDFGKSYWEAQEKISKGQASKPLAEDASDEDKAAYRESLGIPADPKGYLENLPDGLVVGDDDREIMEDFMGALHSIDAPPAVAQKAVAWYNDFAEKQQDLTQQRDQEMMDETATVLRDEWGGDYRANMNLVKTLVTGTFGESADAILNARGPDGAALMNNPEILKAFSQLSREINGPATLMPTNTSNPAQGAQDRLVEIKKQMQENPTAYFKDEAVQKEYRDLLDWVAKKSGKVA